jgi:2-(1,2-epoxy-1,2-dihydrophenyl)acetyl-CoA isomerase
MAAAGANEVKVASDGSLGEITLSNPGGVHMIDESFPDALKSAVATLDGAPAVRTVVLGGDSKVFCAGADLSLAERLRDPEFGAEWLRTQHDAILRLARMRMPVVAAVAGAAYGAGFNLALACDFIVASDSASFSQAFVRVGIATDMGSPFLLPRRVGVQRARELMYTGRSLTAAEALEIGAVDEVVAPDRVADRARELAAELAAGPPLALAAMKRALATATGDTLEQALDRELQAEPLASSDFEEGATAFSEKRAPNFEGS